MSKIKIIINSAAQWQQALNKVKSYGAISRDGSTIFLPSKPDMVVDTGLSAGVACILASRTGYMPKKNPYAAVISFNDLMNAQSAPWNSYQSATADQTNPQPQVIVQHVEVPVYVPVPTPVGVCAQTTLRVSAVEIAEQQAIIFNTVGIPWLVENGLDITEDNGKMYIVDAAANSATEFTAATASANAAKSLLDNDIDDAEDIWARYAITHDLIVSVTHSKEVEVEED